MSKSALLRATATPLASIFGSGFLVIVPILASATGRYSIISMAGICLLAYSVGAVIRFNIANAEPVLGSSHPPAATLFLDRASDITLVPAYVISVCLYLKILSSFVTRGLGISTAFNQDMLTSGVILLITVVGVIRGLKMLQKLEDYAIWVTMGIITLMILAFGIHDVSLAADSAVQLPGSGSGGILKVLAVLGGTLICVQGFETSRYLGEEFSRSMRIRSCRLSQLIAAAVYMIFITVSIPLMNMLSGPASDDALITMAGGVWKLLPVPLISAAVLSQFSAAIADTLGGEGNMVEATGGRLTHRISYIIIGAGAIVLTWSANTFQIVALASRAFAAYYALQCLVAATVSRKILQKAGMLLVFILLVAIAVFAVPAG